jgi:hypothetical protein
MLQPMATILASLVVVGVTGYFGWHQREIAREQARIAHAGRLKGAIATSKSVRLTPKGVQVLGTIGLS